MSQMHEVDFKVFGLGVKDFLFEIVLGFAQRRGGDDEPAHKARFQGHDLPASDGRVARLAGTVAPAARPMLGADDEVDRRLGGLSKVVILA